MGVLEGKVAIVTGAGRGMGRSHALALAREGARVVVNTRKAPDGAPAPVDEVVREIADAGSEAVASYEDVSDFAAAKRIIDCAIDSFGRLDILVNNAGLYRDRMIFKMSPEEWDIVIKVDLYGVYNCTRPACMIFREQGGGRIINTSSEAGLGNMGQSNYSAAQEGVIGFTRTVARDMGKYGVTCNAIRPRAATRITDLPELREAIERAKATGAAMPPGADLMMTLPQPEDMVPFVVYLATDEAAGINGCTFMLSGDKISLYSEPQEIKTINPRAGKWTLDELMDVVPGTLGAGLVNPAPPKPKE